jgi:hypothetical protein
MLSALLIKMMQGNKSLYILLFSFLLTAYACAQTGDSLTIKYNYINSLPQNAKVYFNDNFAGETPFRFTSEQVDTGKSLTITLKLEGYLDYPFNATPSDFPINKSVTLIPVNNLSLMNDKLVEENKSSYFKTPRKVVPIVITSVISAGSGVLSFYFKKTANDKYDEYLATGNKDKFDETKKYDLYSGIFLALFQVGLAGLLYFLLID